MKFKSDEKNIKNLLDSKKAFVIPRFQREYSWKISEIKDFWFDLLNSCINKKERKLEIIEYFWGTMLFVGDFENVERKMLVIDGQQRLTTMTILLSVIINKFATLGQKKLKKQKKNDEPIPEEMAEKALEKYIIGITDDGEEYRVLENETPNPFFANYIQKNPQVSKYEPNSEEEDNISKAYDFFKNQLNERKIKDFYAKKEININSYDFFQILKMVRDQLLNSKIIYITTDNKKDASQIFEILNARGKDLNAMDLIKNSLFEVLCKETPADDAKNAWNKVKENLEDINRITFFRHYWASKYNKVNVSNLYKEFLKEIKKTEKDYYVFLEDIERESRIYYKITIPRKEDWEESYIYKTINFFDIFDISQVRILLLGIMFIKEKNTKDNKYITDKQIRRVLKIVEDFHFAFTVICSKRPSQLEGIYSNISKKIRNSTSSQQTNIIIDELIKELTKLMPSKEEYEEGFKNITYDLNIRKSLNKIYYIFEKIEKKLDTYSEKELGNVNIEHVISQSNDKKYENIQNIGNLLLLGKSLNSGELGNKSVVEKYEIYPKSEMSHVKEMIQKYKAEDWDDNIIVMRAKDLADSYYEGIIMDDLKQKVETA